MADQNNLKLGDWNAICDVCGFKYKASDLRMRWDNLYVCKDDFELRHPSDFFKGFPDNQTVPWARLDDTCTEGSTYTDVAGNVINQDCAGNPSNVANIAVAGWAIAGFILEDVPPI